MEYSPGEIELVRSCINNTDDNGHNRLCIRKGRGRSRKECPAWQPCVKAYEQDDDASGPCEQILSNMEEQKELTEDQILIVNFWLNGIKWEDEENCVPYAGAKQCPNWKEFAYCPICEGLLRKLGVYEPYEYDIYEEAIQKVIVRDAPREWSANEELKFHAEKPSTKIKVGEPDILLIGADTKTLYVVELKRTRATREHVGQLASYVGWYRKHREDRPEECKDKDVKGILLAPEFDERAIWALIACDGLEPRCFDLHAEIKPVQKWNDALI